MGGVYLRVTNILFRAKFNTVCQETNYPNMFECFSKNTSTFMILGDQCTRTRYCRFCNVTAGQDIINHSIETVARLYPRIRPEAIYGRSLDLISTVKQSAPDMPTKSGIMVGLGETQKELVKTMDDLFKKNKSAIKFLRSAKKRKTVIKNDGFSFINFIDNTL